VRRIHLDHAASTPCATDVLEAMLPWIACGANAASAHAEGRAAASAVDRARHAVARMVVGTDASGGAEPSAARSSPNVVFTSGATEANALALAGGGWWTSAVEHPSVRAWAAGSLAVDADGVVDPAEVSRAAAAGAVGVSVMLANNETGVLQPVADVIAAGRACGLRVHVDASQAPGRIGLEALIGADLVTLSAHKIGGPQGVGALLYARGVRLDARARGGPQERGARAGTHSVAAIVGFGRAAERVEALVSDAPRVAALRDLLQEGLVAMGGRVASAGAQRLPNIVAAAFPGVDAADLVMALDLEGVACSAGSACASGSQEPSHVLRAMGFLDGPWRGGAVRFSLGADTVEPDVRAALEAVRRVLARL
jgi:cysteine desulfurase